MPKYCDGALKCAPDCYLCAADYEKHGRCPGPARSSIFVPWQFIPWHCNGAMRCAGSLPLCSRLREAQTLHAGPYACHVSSCQSTAAAPSTVPDCCLCRRSRDAQVPHVDPYSCHNSSCQSLETTLCAVPDRSPRLLPLCSRSYEAQMLTVGSNPCHSTRGHSHAPAPYAVPDCCLCAANYAKLGCCAMIHTKP